MICLYLLQPCSLQTMRIHTILKICYDLQWTSIHTVSPSLKTETQVPIFFSARGNQRPVWNMSQSFPLQTITVTHWPLWQSYQLQADRLTDSKHRSVIHTKLDRQGMENRCTGLVWHWQFRPHQHFNQHQVKPGFVPLTNRPASALKVDPES